MPLTLPPAPPALVARPWAALAAALPDHPASAAVSQDHRAAALRDLRARHAAEAALPLLAGAESRLLVHEPPTGKGTAVLLHGWTAATNQYDEMSTVLFEAGYDLWVPRLPGHGLKDPATGEPDPSQLPRAGEPGRYAAFADEVHALVSRLGGSIHLVGLSGGAAIALDIAERHPGVAHTVAMAPFLNVPNMAETVLPHVIDALDTVLLGASAATLDAIPFGWGEVPGEDHVVGYNQFKVGNVTGLRRYGYPVGERLGTLRTPTQFLTSAMDHSVSDRHLRLAFANGAPQGLGWFEFPASDGVPHPMIAPACNRNPASRRRIIEMVRDFLDSGRPVGTGPLAR